MADEVVLGSTEITRSDSGEVDSGTVPDQSLEVDTGSGEVDSGTVPDQSLEVDTG